MLDCVRLPIFSLDLQPADIGIVDQWVREMRTADGIVGNQELADRIRKAMLTFVSGINERHR